MGKSKRLIKVCRASGAPVRPENVEAWTQEYRALYDKVLLKFKVEEGKQVAPEIGMRIQKLMDRLEKGLNKKYPNIEQWEPVRSVKVWEDLVKQYGPIMLAREENGNLAYVIYDLGFPEAPTEGTY